MAALPRRAALCLPALLIAGQARAGGRVPPFPDWIGRTARLRSEAGDARLLLAADGSGLIAVRAFFACRPLPVLSWRIAANGQELAYRRASALVPGRVIAGMARIDAEGAALHWIEAREELAEFEGFVAAEAARHCG
ncbi:hypothetical protein ACFOD3_00480 [Falsiroseomonas tokyonensis]|uniref:Uncharacterized protein n=2 Tax=Falsiroseomonas tokyonensis TaxID=430521 RepID=A0ABV7BM54_9PROT|nr:hypothetical protein [Falsiroseomonas tokyonensis]